MFNLPSFAGLASSSVIQLFLLKVFSLRCAHPSVGRAITWRAVCQTKFSGLCKFEPMPPELRKRKAPAEDIVARQAATNNKRKKKRVVVEAVAAAKESSPAPAIPTSTSTSVPVPSQPERKTRSAAGASTVAVGETIALEGFGGEIETNDGEKTTLAKLVAESDRGVVVFTYPKASTSGCTTQACLFRDRYKSLTATGFTIYGLSKDSTKANTKFKEDKNLPYPLLCDSKATLISAIGLKKAPAGTKRGVFVVDKSGTVLAAETGGPAATVDVVQKLVDQGSNDVVDDSADHPNGDVPANSETTEE